MNENKKNEVKKAAVKEDPKKVKKAAVSVVDEVKHKKVITSKQLGAYQKATKGKAVVDKAKKNNGN